MTEQTSIIATIERNENKLLRFALSLLGNRQEAEDVVQDVFLKLVEKRPVFESESHETAWLITVAKNKARSLLRSPWRKNRTELLDEYPAETSEQRELIETISALSPIYKAVIHLYYYEGYSTKEIAEITGSKEATARSRLKRAREKLKRFLQEREEL